MKGYHSPRISSEYKDCSLPLTFDQYNTCSFGCKYCFSVQFRECNPTKKKNGSNLGNVNASKLCDIFKGKYQSNEYYKNLISKRFVFHWGGLAEPFCHIEKKYGTGLEIIKFLKELKYPTLFSTKGLSLIVDNPNYINIFESASKDKNFAFQFSIVANDDKLSEAIEPNTPVTSERLRAMKRMSELGFWTILRLRPFIIGITDIELEDLLTRAKNNGAKAVSTEFFAIDKKVASSLQKSFSEVSKIIGFDLLNFYDQLSPRERGGYMRLNRDVKEPFMKRLYIKCKELGLQVNISDPDFKEINMTGCCCGLPYVHENIELTNWSKGQITEALVKLRRRYWESEGVDKYIKFEEVDKEVFNNWYEEKIYYFRDSIKRWSTDYSKLNSNHKKEFKGSWNNLRSPDNPYNHYHGILKPSYLDKDGLIVYEYSPRSYEYRWKKEGIL